MKHFNDLTPAQAERIAYLMEECGEVIQTCAKILRHGFNSYNPDDPKQGEPFIVTNRKMLEREIGDVFTACNLLTKSKDILNENLIKYTKDKPNRYMHHQD